MPGRSIVQLFQQTLDNSHSRNDFRRLHRNGRVRASIATQPDPVQKLFLIFVDQRLTMKIVDFVLQISSGTIFIVNYKLNCQS